MKNEKVKRVQELRRSNAATPIKNKKKYNRKTKNEKNKILQLYSDLVSPFFKQLKIQLNLSAGSGVSCLTLRVIFLTQNYLRVT